MTIPVNLTSCEGKFLFMHMNIVKNPRFCDLSDKRLQKPKGPLAWLKWVKDMLLLSGSVLIGLPWYKDDCILAEGDDITLFGLLKYNTDTDSFEMPAIEFGFIGGRDRI